jgi:hypothetical protein
MPAANGALALVPVCSVVHVLGMSAVTIAGWLIPAELYVDASELGHSSEYQGFLLSNVAELMLSV